MGFEYLEYKFNKHIIINGYMYNYAALYDSNAGCVYAYKENIRVLDL